MVKARKVTKAYQLAKKKVKTLGTDHLQLEETLLTGNFGLSRLYVSLRSDPWESCNMLDRQAEVTSRSEDPQNPGQSGSKHVRWHASHHTSTSSDKACWSFDPEKDLAIMPRCQLVQKPIVGP